VLRNNPDLTAKGEEGPCLGIRSAQDFATWVVVVSFKIVILTIGVPGS